MMTRTPTSASVTICSILIYLCTAIGSAQAPAPSPAIFPGLSATTLDKAKIDLPSGFTGALNLLLIGFEREQQKDIDTWLPFTREVEAMHPQVHAWELPVMSRETLLFRWYLESSMRSSFTEPLQRQRTIPLYLNKESFRRSLSIETEKQITVLLLDKSGKVLWRTIGILTPAAKSALLTAITAQNQ